MIDLIRFVARGAVAGAILPLVLISALISIFLGPGVALKIFLAVFYWFLIPGAVVGLALWVIARFRKRLPADVRFVVGTLIQFVLVCVLLLGLISAWSEDKSSLLYVPLCFVWILIASAGVGGVAGVACPDALSRKKEPELTYWERVALYEMAEREASFARARSHSPQHIKSAKEGAK